MDWLEATPMIGSLTERSADAIRQGGDKGAPSHAA
jgi:hypothetical protein